MPGIYLRKVVAVAVGKCPLGQLTIVRLRPKKLVAIVHTTLPSVHIANILLGKDTGVNIVVDEQISADERFSANGVVATVPPE